jgi:SUKH-3 immunity protein
MASYTPEVEGILREAGWRPGRHAYVETWLERFAELGCEASDAAIEFLVEFGGLDVQISGRGLRRAREPFVLDPILCEGDLDRFVDWSGLLGRRLFPIGVLGSAMTCLGMDERSVIYLVESRISSFGPMPSALEGLVLGAMPEAISVA